MRRIQEQIKNGDFKRAYLLYGDEAYLIRNCKTKLIAAMVGEGDEMNCLACQGKAYDVNEIRDFSQTFPFFADRKLVVMEDSGAFKNAADELVSIVKEAPETTFFLFVDTEVDKRNKLFKLVNEIGYATELKTPTAEDMTTWLARKFNAAGKKIKVADMNLLMERAGQESNMDHLNNEAEKLIAYVGDREVITAGDIDGICITQTVDRVFDMVNAIALRDGNTAIRLYADLVNLKEPPLKILALLGRQFAQLLGVKELLDEGNGSQVIADKLGIRPYFVGKYISQARNFTAGELSEAVEDCVEAEQAVKTGIRDEGYAVELVLLKYCRADR